MLLPPDSLGKIIPQTDTEAADTDVVITLAAQEKEWNVLHAIQYSYSETPSGGGITVVIGGTTVFDFDISGTEGTIEFPAPVYQKRNQAMVITLKAGGGTAVGTLNIQTS